LFFIVQPSGAKSWAIRLRRPDGRTAKLTLGPCNLTGDPIQGGKTLTLAQARAQAASLDEQRKNGIDVILEIETEQLRKQAEKVDRAANSFGAVIRQFFIEYRTDKWQERPRRWRDDAITLGLRWPKGCNPATEEPKVIAGSLAELWDKKPITAITKFDVEAVITDARKHGSPGKSRKMYSVLSVLFGWLPLKFNVDVNPVLAVKRPRPPPPRPDKLDEAGIRMFWQAADVVGGNFGAIYKLLLLTGARLREVSGMRHAELDAKKGVWEIPGSRTKNHLPFMVPLPPSAFDIIASVVPPTNSNNEAGLVFTSNGKSPVSGFGKAKKALDAEMAKIAGQLIKPWRNHDLRRTVSTIMNESPSNPADENGATADEEFESGLGIAPHIVEALLNHISGQSKVAGIYNKAKYLTEKRAALLRWSVHIDGIVSGKPSNVTTLHKAAKA
jgi:integrase